MRRHPSTTAKHALYVQLFGAEHGDQAQVSALGHILDRGVGTASDPQASWYELRITRLPGLPFFYQILSEAGLPVERVARLTIIRPGEGSAQARTLPLVPDAPPVLSSLSGTAAESAPKVASAPDPEQLHLFGNR